MKRFRPLALLAAAAASMAGGPARATMHRAVLCGETVKSSLEAVQAFDFTAVEGEAVSITVAATPCAGKRCAALGWGLTDSSGRPVPTTGGQLCGGQCEARLPASDTFTIWVGAIGGPGREFFLSLDAVSATAGGQPNGPPSPSCARTGADGQPDGTRVIDATAPMAGAVSVAGDADTFTFVGAPGDVLRVEVSPTGAAFDPQWQLFDPRGERVLTADGAASCASACDTQSLASAGTFTIEVSDARLDASGAYAIRLARGSTTDTTTSVTLPAITTTTMVTLPPITTTTTPGPVGLHELAVTLRPPAAAVLSEQMGAALAASGDTILIGAPHDGTAAHDAGLVYAVGVAGGPASPGFGRLLGTLRTPGTPAAGDAFGAAIAAVGNGVLVGAPGDDRGAPDGGAAYLFPDLAGTAPIVLVPPAPVAGERLGFALGTLGDDLLVGAPGSGKVYRFRATGDLVLTFAPPEAAASEGFGSAIGSLGGKLVVVGAPGSGSTRGKLLIFDAATGAFLLALENPLGQVGDAFGASIAAAGPDLLVGAPGTGGVFLFAATGILRATFLSPTKQADARFGASIAVAGTDLAIGAPGEGSEAPDGGATYVFDLVSGVLRHVVRRPEPQAGGRFGTAVAAVGSRLLIGAPGDDAGVVGGGAAHLFSGTTLEAMFRKRLSDAGFGASVAAAAGGVLVGAPHGGAGAGYVSRFDPSTGAAGATVASPAPGEPRFGFSIAALGDDLVAGAPFQAGAAGPAVGAAYVFAGAALRATLGNPRPVGGDQLGFSVATVGSDVLVGVPLAGAQDTGVVYRFDGASGALRATFQKPTPVTGDFFGAAVAGEGDGVLVGAPLDGTAGGNAGGAYLFRRDTAVLDRIFANPAAAPGDLFGAAVALTGRLAIVGAPRVGAGAPESGAVYVFDRATGSLVRVIDNPTPGSGDHFGQAVATDGVRLLVGAELDDTSGLDAGAAYLFDAGTGALLDTFLDPAGGAFDHFGAALSATASGLLIGAPASSRAYLFRPTGQAAASAAPSAFTPRALAVATGGGRCGNGIVEPGEECDDGNTRNLDDCRSNCTRPICCTLDPLAAGRCDDGNPCTDDALDPARGCTSVPNGRCCRGDADCASGKCRMCVGCFLYPWDCCERGSTCLATAAECAGIQCLAGAYCLCTGGLACADGAVPSLPGSLFSGACDELRLEESLSPIGRPAFQATRSHVRKARRMMKKAAKSTRRMMSRGDLSRPCGKAILIRIKTVKRAIPRGKRLRQCLLAR